MLVFPGTDDAAVPQLCLFKLLPLTELASCDRALDLEEFLEL